jgi:hypothetical protein
MLLLATIGLAGCGDGIADNVAVRVGKTSIAAATVAHWMSVIAGEVSTAPGQPEPEVPQPPRYTRCIAYRARYPTVPGQPTPTAGRLKQECELEFQKEKLKALYFLIPYTWVSGEAAQLGVSVTDQALRRQIAQLEKQGPSEAELRKFFVGTRGTVADLLSRLKLNLLMTRVQQKLEHERATPAQTVEQRQQALNRFSEQFVRRWTTQTDCRPAYVVPICRQYKPPKVAPALVPPSIPLTKMTAE